mmetsp:Transcript_29530/g.68904  ORF Transcript_29530/g.68904 Transcript_29530/m.68904 type:complete len:129 (-) Transcript_29530:1632-2018(-)
MFSSRRSVHCAVQESVTIGQVNVGKRDGVLLGNWDGLAVVGANVGCAVVGSSVGGAVVGDAVVGGIVGLAVGSNEDSLTWTEEESVGEADGTADTPEDGALVWVIMSFEEGDAVGVLVEKQSATQRST